MAIGGNRLVVYIAQTNTYTVYDTTAQEVTSFKNPTSLEPRDRNGLRGCR